MQKLFETIQHWKCLYEEEHEKLTKEQENQKNNDEIIRVCFPVLFDSLFTSPQGIFSVGRLSFLLFDTTNTSYGLRTVKKEQRLGCFEQTRSLLCIRIEKKTKETV